MRFASGFLAAIALLILVALAVSYSGVVNVAAREPDNPVSAWFLSNTMQRSVRQQASGIAAPRQASEEEVNPGGRPKVPAEVREAAMALTARAIEVLGEIMEDKHAPPATRVMAADTVRSAARRNRWT